MAPIVVLMVAEKPSIALAIASTLSGGQMTTRKSRTDVHEFEGWFHNCKAHFKVTSVMGHVFSVDFPQKFKNWTATDPADLFDVQIQKTEANPKVQIQRHLSQEARGCNHLVLWLDCDREGENICFEVIQCTGFDLNDFSRNIFRARFSSVTEKDIIGAMARLTKPNKNEALAVDARSEIDLKVGVAFTRFQTHYFQGKYGNLDSRVISYGPCQTPTLGFCVQRHLKISTFKPEKYWKLCVSIMLDGYEVSLEWNRHKLFDVEVAKMFQDVVTKDGILVVTTIDKKEEVNRRPTGLNTVNLLKVASSALGLGPQTTMQLAERLYTQGFISYPRSESTAYPSTFDFKGTLDALARCSLCGEYASQLLAAGYHKPRSGNDAGDHPPITPMLLATENSVGRDAWKLYHYICQHFLATVSPDCKYLRCKVEFEVGGEIFHCTGLRVLDKGFTSVMPWLALKEINLPSLKKSEKIEVSKVELHEGLTSPPDYLTESELISLMEKNGIGTDASISVHINNICERNYVQVQPGRKLAPTALGVTLIRGYQCIDPDLCLPDIRSFIEQQITLIANGRANHYAVVQHVLHQFKQKYLYFVKQIDGMDSLFEAQFLLLSDTGRLLSKCGKCLRYMKYLPSQPPRLYCGICEEVYYLPQNGTVKLYKELTCPIDNFELLIHSMGGPYGKSVPLCPYCYNNSPFDGIVSVIRVGQDSRMPCSLCPHPTCKHSMHAVGVCACPDCSGTLVLDPISAPKWKLFCNLCNCLVLLPQGAHKISCSPEKCVNCSSTSLEVDFNKNSSPLPNEATLHVGCIICDELLHSLVEVKHGTSFPKRGGFRGRGRGRGPWERTRVSAKKLDPKMSFTDF